MTSLVVGPLAGPDVLVELLQGHAAVLVLVQFRQFPPQLCAKQKTVAWSIVEALPVYLPLGLST